MNYIHRLQAEVASNKALCVDARDQVDALVRYLSSNKFRCGDSLDNYVNINDILPALMQVKLTLSDGC